MMTTMSSEVIALILSQELKLFSHDSQITKIKYLKTKIEHYSSLRRYSKW